MLIGPISLFIACSMVAAPPFTKMTEEQQTLYALGFSSVETFRELDLNPREIQSLTRGIFDGAAGRLPPPTTPEDDKRIEHVLQAHKDVANERKLRRAAAEPDATRATDGWVVKILSPGKGPLPGPLDEVRIRFTGTTSEGAEFESTYKRNSDAIFGLGSVITCWTRAFQAQHQGAHFKLTCPSNLAYGESGFRPLIPPNEVLVFDIEFLELRKGTPDAGPVLPRVIPNP